MPSSDTYPQHVVTAVIVAHDGAAWLPQVLDALLEQTRPVQRVVAVDTGSRDRSGAVLTGKLGQGAVFGMDRATGYAAAVTKALQHRAANTRVQVPARPGAGDGEHVEWIWLLHDDCEPAGDALEQLLRGAAETPKAAVLGPKVMDWSDRDVLLEAGLTIDTVGRRVTGIEPREVDQGQHDGDRDTLAVSSAGMLIRRDVWDQLRGFDTAMALFREDIDFCWRVHAAGFRVRVITDAVVFHVQAASRRRRAVSVGRRGALLDRRNALLTLAGNLPLRPMLASLAGNVTLSVLRALFFLVAKRVTAALDETAAVASVLGHPLRLMRVRRMRARGRKAAYGRLRADIPPGRSVRRVAEFLAALTSSGKQDTHGSHHATEDDADDFLLTDSGIAQRILTSPAVLLFIGLVIVTVIAERSLLSAGSLGGGALLPATQGASGLWRQYLQGFHPTGVGSPSVAPPYLAIVAVLATVLLGKAWLAVDVLLLGSVPIAGMAAYRAARQVTASVPIRIWAAAAYALLPVGAGAISAGRLGSAVAFAAVPVIGLLAGRMFSQPPRLARRAAWATGLAIAAATAFVPLLWPLSLLAAGAAALTLRAGRPALLRNLGIVALVPPVVLVPWTLQLASHPSALLLEAGVQQPGLATPGLPASSLLLLSPGGPGLPPAWVTAGLALAALVPLLAARRRNLVMSGWAVALLSLFVAVLVSRVSVRPPAGGPAVTAWPGAVLAVTAAGLLLAAAGGGDSLTALLPAGRSALSRLASLRGLGITVLVLAASSAPALAGGFWLLKGINGPIGADSGQVVPALVSVAAPGGTQARTLVLSTSPAGQISYLLLRGSGPVLGDADLIPVPAAESALRAAVAALTAPAGGQAVNQGAMLARFDISYVLMRAPVDPDLARTLDGVPGLRAVVITNGFDLWRLTTLPARVSVVEPGGAVVPVRSGPLTVSGAPVPVTGGILTLAEPGGGWHAALNGRPLTPVASPDGSWAQAFRLPSGGGTLTLGRGQLGHDLGLAFEFLVVLVVGALALPGVRAAAEAQPAPAPAPGATPDATPVPVPAAPGLAAPGLAAAQAARAPATGEQPAGRAGSRLAARASAKGRGRGTGRRGRRAEPAQADPGIPEPKPGRAAGTRGTPRNPASAGASSEYSSAGFSFSDRERPAAAPGTADSGFGVPDAGLPGRNSGLPSDDSPPAARPPRPMAWPAGQPTSRFVGEAPSYGTSGPDSPGYAGASGRSYDSPPYDRTDYYARPGSPSPSGSDDSAADRTAAFDSSALRSTGRDNYGRDSYPQDSYPQDSRNSRDIPRRDIPRRDSSAPDSYGPDSYSPPPAARRPSGYPAAGLSDAPYGSSGHSDHSDTNYGSPDYGTPEYSSPDYSSPDYGRRPAGRPASPSGSNLPPLSQPPGPPGRDAGMRSPTGSWPAPDDPAASLPPAPPDRISRARLPGDPAPAAESPYGPPSWSSPPQPSQPSQPSRPPQPGPGRAQPAPPRPDPGWPDDRWPDARQRGAATPQPPAHSSGGWPQPDARPSWPDSDPPSAWPAATQQSQHPQQSQQPQHGQPQRGGWHGNDDPAAWSGGQQSWAPPAQQPGWATPDGLDPLPSAELHHGPGPAAPGQDERTRRRWPAPQADEDEGDTW